MTVKEVMDTIQATRYTLVVEGNVVPLDANDGADMIWANTLVRRVCTYRDIHADAKDDEGVMLEIWPMISYKEKRGFISRILRKR